MKLTISPQSLTRLTAYLTPTRYLTNLLRWNFGILKPINTAPYCCFTGFTAFQASFMKPPSSSTITNWSINFDRFLATRSEEEISTYDVSCCRSCICTRCSKQSSFIIKQNKIRQYILYQKSVTTCSFQKSFV